MYKVEVYIENQRVDLFDDERISVVSSVQNIEDISRVFNDYSQSFTVPASPRNNRIFSHYYNANITTGFDARVRHEARIEINAMNFRQGTIRLEAVQIRNNKPEHYKLTFFGQLIDLKEVIGDDYLSDLDTADYDFQYSSANIKTALETGLFSGDIVAPLISTKRQWFYNSNSSVTTYTDLLSNIAWNGSGADHGVDWLSLRPAIKVSTVVDLIESKYGIVFSNDFLNTSGAFANLYLWLANEDSEDLLVNTTRITDYDENVQDPIFGTFDNSSGAWIDKGLADQIIVTAQSSDGVQYTIQVMQGNQVLGEETGTGNRTLTVNFTGNDNQEYYVRIKNSADKSITYLRYEIKAFDGGLTICDSTKYNIALTGTTAQVIQLMPPMKVIDFLKSIISYYNLVVVPNSATDFKIQTLDEWYQDGKVYDITQWVDTQELEVERPTIFKQISFRHAESSTILAEEFESQNNVGYGDLETKLKDASGNPLDGDEFEIEVDFEQMVYERLNDLETDEPTNIVYGLSADKSISSVSPEAHLFYAYQKSVASNPLSFVGDDGNKSQINGNVYMPSHVNGSDRSYATTFGGDIDEHSGASIVNSLFSLYYKDYITDSFSARRRKYRLTALLPVWLVNNLKLNDRLIIKEERYIINQMTVEVTSGLVKFELLNDIYNLNLSDTATEPAETTPNPSPGPSPGGFITDGTSFSISSTGSATRNGGCSLSPTITRYWEGGTPGYPTLGNTIYTDLAKTNIFNGNNLYYKIANDRVIQIGTNGRVWDIYDCAAGASL